MTPHHAYRRQDQYAALSRIDLLLALYDGAVGRLTQAEAALSAGDPAAATPHMVKTQLIVAELAAGVRTKVDERMGTDMLRLYEFVVNALRTPRLQGVRDARQVLLTLREGFDAVRDEANRLERAGHFAGAGREFVLSATA